MVTCGRDDYGKVFCATGARGFCGEGYPFHGLWSFFGADWSGTNILGKTITLLPHVGNMPLNSDGVTPKEIFPRCIVAGLRHGGWMLNAVGLSNRGAEFYLKSGEYRKIQKPFFISFKCMAEERNGREAEMRDFCQMFKKYMPFRSPVALQLNEGCPNLKNKSEAVQEEICQRVSIAKAELNIPVFVNTNALMPTSILKEVSRVADGFIIGNTIPWRDPETLGYIDWDLYGGRESPLRIRGIGMDGGLSGHDCLQFTTRKIRELRDVGVHKPIIGGNGIRSVRDVALLEDSGADGIFIGSLAVVCPYRMARVVKYAQSIFTRRKTW